MHRKIVSTLELMIERSCPSWLLAWTWMYLGIVRGSSAAGLDGARDAFDRALALDPEVVLDAALATPEVRNAFDDARSALADSE
jgi:hypothetical protein